MCTSESKRLIGSVLQYLESFERCAALRNQRAGVQHYQDCWVLVHSTFFGDGMTQSVAPVVYHQSGEAVESWQRPRWFTLKYSRPVRRVVAQVSERETDRDSGEVSAVLFDVLDCGHKLLARVTDAGERRGRRRWCDQCPPKGEKQWQPKGQLLQQPRALSANNSRGTK